METWIDYDLPKSLIAQEPLANRADARLMLVDRQSKTIEHRHVRDLPSLLAVGDRLVLNDTKVIPAQLRGLRDTTGGRWQGLFLGATDDGEWRLVCKTRGRLQAPERIRLIDRHGRESIWLWLLEKRDGGEWLARPEADRQDIDLLEEVGHVPLPPYIRKGNMVDSDVTSYQTVFAKHPGAVAAPTAGLHFTKDLLRSMAQSGVEFSAVTLHVGPGTFQPVTADDPSEHRMHAEWGELTEVAARELNRTRSDGGRVVAVGTTVCRVLESVAQQTDSESAERATFQPWRGNTDLFIRPPYPFRGLDALMTNFHFPRTTLLLLVQAFGGSELIAEAYRQAVEEEYRFYSYGDAMLIV